MAISGALPVEFGAAFPYGCGMIGQVEPMNDFDQSTRENRVQARDKDTGLPVWQLTVLDFDPEAREKTLKVKIAAAVQPVPPGELEGAPIRPIVLEGLRVTAYIKDGPRPKIGYSLRASALAAPGRAAKPQAA